MAASRRSSTYRSHKSLLFLALALAILPPHEAEGSLWRPAPGDSFAITLSQDPVPPFAALIYEIDLHTDQKIIQLLKDNGKKTLCYISAGTLEKYRPDAADFPRAALGAKLPFWPDERYLDIRDERVVTLMKKRIALCAQKQFDGVVFDNLDVYQNQGGFSLTEDAALAYAVELAAEAHERGLIVGITNASGLGGRGQEHFDFAVIESCFWYRECGDYLPYLQAGKAVFDIEYEANPQKQAIICTQAKNIGISVIFKDKNLNSSLTGLCR